MAVDYCRIYENIDLVLMDLQLPVLDGIEAIKQIRTFKPCLPIIVQTANALHDEWERCTKAGCNDFITKPINLQDMMNKIGKLLQPSKVLDNQLMP
jgi:CheY-like chemotaxis protein